jgi:TolA-binding protein
VTRIEFLTRLRATGMPIRQMQQLARLFYERPEAISDRRAILEDHQRNVEQHIQELQQNLAAIQQKIRFYQELEQRAKTDPTMMISSDDRMLCITQEPSCQTESNKSVGEAAVFLTSPLAKSPGLAGNTDLH